MTDSAIQGNLFANDFLQDMIKELPEWSDLNDARLDALTSDLNAIFQLYPTTKRPNESQTEDDLIWPTLVRLGWTQSLRQQNLAAQGRDDADMTNVSGLFLTREELEEKEGAYPIGGNRFRSAKGEYLPLYEGKMVQAFDHRAAGIVVNPANQHRPAQPVPATVVQRQNPAWLPKPQFWIDTSHCTDARLPYILAFKDVTSPTNKRSMLAALIPSTGVGNKLPLILSDVENERTAAPILSLLLANFLAIVFDFVARQKIQGQHLNWFTVEQLPSFPPSATTLPASAPRPPAKSFARPCWN